MIQGINLLSTVGQPLDLCGSYIVCGYRKESAVSDTVTFWSYMFASSSNNHVDVSTILFADSHVVLVHIASAVPDGHVFRIKIINVRKKSCACWHNEIVLGNQADDPEVATGMRRSSFT